MSDVLSLARTRRLGLLRLVEFIFPIESVSPTDLLFSIVGVPLPVPVNPADPAPPLSVPSQPLINEETIASALGYAAQVVQFLAVYLGRLLPYPVTCTGSRSLIKDPISTMHGPRMQGNPWSYPCPSSDQYLLYRFPLFSRGVDTYRFEYAVFLLNKDIEIVCPLVFLEATRTEPPALKADVRTQPEGDGHATYPT